MRLPRLFAVPAILLILASFVGCPGKRQVSNTGTSSNESSADDLLVSAVHQLRPLNYSIDAAADKPVSLLNSWRGLAPDSSPVINDKVPAGWIDESQEVRLKAENFDLLDAVHIRDAMLTHAIASYLSTRASDEVGQAQAVFDFVIRNVALRGDDDPEMPLGIYQLLLLGQGNAEDRAWVTASLFRQLRLDSVIVRPKGDKSPDNWLLGVLLKGQVYLFDPRLGLALPSGDAAAKVTPPATLAEIVSHPEWLERFSVRSDGYPIKAESLKEVDVFPIVEVNWWTRRIRHLESVLPASDLCVLSDPLFDATGREGLLSRLKGAGWSPDSLKPWPYPQRQNEAMKKATPAIKQSFEIATQTFNLPIPFKVSEDGQVKFGNPERKLLRIRTEQLLGKFDDATQRYMSIRHLEIEQVPVPEMAVLNRKGAENAIYWTALCKFEAKEYDAAIEQLNAYLKRYDRSGQWRFAARALLADCHAELGHLKEAIDALERSRSDDPYRLGNAVRVKQWKARQ